LKDRASIVYESIVVPARDIMIYMTDKAKRNLNMLSLKLGDDGYTVVTGRGI